MRGAAPAVVCAALALAGCRATPAPAVDDMAVDMASGGDDLAVGDDLGGPDLAVCPTGPEICGNGCDDDRNGYTDDDDPACTTQMLVTMSVAATPALWRLILEPTPHVVALDGNPVDRGGMATYNAAFTGAAFVSFDGSTRRIDRVPPGGTKTSYSPAFQTRDVCVFNGELIVVDPRSGPSYLHRFMSDGKTEVLPAVPVANTASACATDGKQLFVAARSSVGPSTIAIFDASGSGPVATGVTLAIPDSLVADGYTRLLDFAYVKKSGLFIGLFAQTSVSGDSALDGQVMAPFTTDGGAGSYVDGGVWHGVGEFAP